MPRYKLTIRYDGSGFHGWQEQVPADAPPLRTVQQVVRQAVQEVARQPVEVTGASRTDTGVHAEGQVAHFDAELSVPIERLALAINARLPDDVEIATAEIAPDGFHAIRGAVDKQYRYRIWNTRRRPLGHRAMVYHCWMDLDRDTMHDAAQRLIGEHDFESFTNAGHGRLSTVREIFDCGVERGPGPELHVVVRGSGFLYNMVRIIVGTLIEVGRGHWPPEYVDQLLREPNRQDAGPTVPPNGLCLEWIKYD